MNIPLSIVGERMNELSGVREIMADIIETLKNADADTLVDLSAGNPLILKDVQDIWDTIAKDIVGTKKFAETIARYGPTSGYPELTQSIVDSINTEFNWGISEKNVIITPGSQFAYYVLFQIFAGKFTSGNKGILFPMLPEYTGYSNMGIDTELLRGKMANIVKTGNHSFKYYLSLDDDDFEDIGVVCFSRPTNPSGNVFTDEEVEEVIKRAEKQNTLVVIDAAYAAPFPNLSFVKMTPFFGKNIAHVMSFSKAGIPGERIGVVVAEEEIIEKIYSFEANTSLHSSRFGQMLVSEALKSGELTEVCKNIINPFYKKKQELFAQSLSEYLSDEIPYFRHEAEGTFFSWLWFEGLPITDKELYTILKKNNLIIVPGSFFFPGYKGNSNHIHETIRISLATTDEKIIAGVKILGKVLKAVYSKK